MKNELVSIITAAYNCAETIFSTSKSVLSQTYPFWEWIIIDDCSTDSSFNVLSSIAASDKRIVLLKTPRNGGPAMARNMGLRCSKGRYITFLDSDDLLDADYLENQVAFIENNGPIVSSGYRRQGLSTCTSFSPPSVVDYKKDLRGNPLSCLTTMYDKSIIGEVYFPEGFDGPEDYVFWLGILKKGYVAKGNPKELATYNIRKGSKSSNKRALVLRMFRVYHQTQRINWVRSWLLVINWAFYGMKKYKGVK